MYGDRKKLELMAYKLTYPIFKSVSDGLTKCMPVEAKPNFIEYARGTSQLELVGRCFCGLAPWIEQKPNLEIHATATRLLDQISNPQSSECLNFAYGTQPLVDASFLATGFLRAPLLWEGLPKSTQDQLIAALQSTRIIRPYFSNWLLFSAVIEAFFCKIDLEWDATRVDYALRQHEQWYLGDGVYSDGPEFHLDYYNSFVIHPLLLEVLWAVRGRQADWDSLYERILARAQRHTVQLERMIASNGTFPPLGRSLAYRCGAFHLLAMLAAKRLLPPELKPAQVRGALMAVIDKTLSSVSNYDEQGWLRIGVNGSQPALGEDYISTGSLYLCTTAFLPLGLPESDPFWSDPDEPWTQKRLWELGDSILIDKALIQI